jgi:hypothetical protein
VRFSADQRRLQTMLESMAGVGDGVRDALTLFTQPLDAYYFVPSIESLLPLGRPSRKPHAWIQSGHASCWLPSASESSARSWAWGVPAQAS